MAIAAVKPSTLSTWPLLFASFGHCWVTSPLRSMVSHDPESWCFSSTLRYSWKGGKTPGIQIGQDVYEVMSHHHSPPKMPKIDQFFGSTPWCHRSPAAGFLPATPGAIPPPAGRPERPRSTGRTAHLKKKSFRCRFWNTPTQSINFNKHQSFTEKATAPKYDLMSFDRPDTPSKELSQANPCKTRQPLTSS